MSADDAHLCDGPEFAGFCWRCAEPFLDEHDRELWPFPPEPLLPPGAATAPDAP